MIRIVRLTVYVGTNYFYVRGQRIMRGEKEGKNREKRRDIQACQFVITKPVMR